MAIPSSGELKLWDTLWNQELGGTKGENSLHSASIYAGFNTPDALGDFYGWSDVEAPAVSTGNASSVAATSMVLNGNVTSTGNQDVSRGFYHGTNANANTNNPKYTVSGTQGTGAFSLTRGSLTYNQTFYFWAWASNDAGETVGSRNQATTNVPSFSPQTTSFQDRTVFSTSPFSQGSASITSQYLNPYTSTYAGLWNSYSGNAGIKVDTGTPSAYNIPARVVNYRNHYSGCGSPRVDEFSGWMRATPITFNSGASIQGGGGGSIYSNNSYCFRGAVCGPNRQGGGASSIVNFYRQSDIRLKTNITYL